MRTTDRSLTFLKDLSGMKLVKKIRCVADAGHWLAGVALVHMSSSVKAWVSQSVCVVVPPLWGKYCISIAVQSRVRSPQCPSSSPHPALAWVWNGCQNITFKCPFCFLHETLLRLVLTYLGTVLHHFHILKTSHGLRLHHPPVGCASLVRWKYIVRELQCKTWTEKLR